MLKYSELRHLYGISMANDTPTRTSFSADNQPENRRGKSFKTRAIEALKRAGKTEDDFMDLIVQKALNGESAFLSELLKRYSPVPKQTLDPVVIDSWPKNGTPTEKAEAVLNCMSQGIIPPDLGQIFIDSISKSLGIEEITEFAKRLEALEKLADAQKA